MNFPEQEQKTIEFWNKNEIFKKTLEKPAPHGSYVFYDGPPFATGLPHYGHILASTIKDVMPRYFTMKGYRVRRVWGWDCHGLPIENIVEKQLGISGKKQIEEKGVDVFNNTCRSAVLTYAGEWGKTVERIGRWVDFEHSYKTMDTKYMESVWWAMKQIWEKGLLYEGRKVLLYCPRCETPLSNFEVAMDNSYKDVTEETATVKFQIKNSKLQFPEGTSILAWTTTPWTLPGNVALAVGADMAYVLAKKGEEHFVLAKDLLNKVLGADTQIVSEFKGSELEGTEYEPLYVLPAVEKSGKKSHYVTVADFVTTEDGTGVVHTAVIYGEDDFNLGLKIDLPMIPVLDAQGNFNEDGPEFVKGEYFKKAEKLIKRDLEDRGLLFDRKQFTHSYPHCWRCDTALFYNAIPAWFVNIQKIKPRLLELNENINWYPEHLKHGRFQNSLETAPDWNISRNRYWATAFPIWKCDEKNCDGIACIGSVDELRTRATNFADVYGEEKELEKLDLHKHNVDKLILTCEKCSGTMSRIPEVIDCWFESASMPFAELHAPFENQELFAERYPAQFVSEYIAQTRAWFQVMHVMGTVLFDKAPFENVVTTGTVLNEKGEKMSKSKMNYPDPNLILEKYGADALRFYLMTSVVMKADNLFFNEREVDETVKKVLNLTSNVLSFYEQYKDKFEVLPELSRQNVLDAWILARLNELIKDSTKEMDAYDTVRTGRLIRTFIDDMSTWYLRRSRDRFKTESEDARAAVTTLRYVLLELSKVMAPFTPFLAEHVYKTVGGEKESVHLDAWPEVAVDALDAAVLAHMGETRAIVSRALERRAEAGIPVRQVLNEMALHLPSGELDLAYQEVLKDEVNVKTIVVEKGDLAVFLDLKLTPELVREGTVREIIRRINAMRKNAGLTIEDRIALYVSGDDQIKLAIEEHKDVLLHGTLSVGVRVDGDMPEINESFRANEFDLVVGFEKV
jgi:isoleucyl-tRNA synthetase